MPSASRTLLLITSSSAEMQKVRRSRVLNFQQITMPYLAAFAPASWTVRHVDEVVHPIDFSMKPDLVAITFHTPSAHHAYATADRFRSLGVPVVLGGPHVTLLPDEAAAHADVIFVGEAEHHWQQFLLDFERGIHDRRHVAESCPKLHDVPFARKELFHRRDHTGGVLFATRGCPHHCEFCTIAVMYRRQLRKRSIASVAAEFGSFPGKVIIFWDDNIATDRDYAKGLFRAITPHRKWWSSQASIHAAQDDEFLRLAAASGCKQLFIGLESISQASMDETGKRFNEVAEDRRAIDRVHSFGIAVQAGIVFGFDSDTPAIFDETIDFLEAAGVDNATFNILTPFPGTRLFRRLEAEGRILSRDWRRYNGRSDVVYQPRQMSTNELLAGYRHANRRFYALKSIRRRLSRSRTGLCWTLPLNLAYALAQRR